MDYLIGVYLPKLCEAKGANARREMSEIKSSGNVAPGPESGFKSVNFKDAPAMAPFWHAYVFTSVLHRTSQEN